MLLAIKVTGKELELQAQGSAVAGMARPSLAALEWVERVSAGLWEMVLWSVQAKAPLLLWLLALELQEAVLQ